MPFAHTALASGLELLSYRNELHEVLSIQSCSVKHDNSSSVPHGAAGSSSSSVPQGVADSRSSEPQFDRLTGGKDASYAFVYPNLMINRYG